MRNKSWRQLIKNALAPHQIEANPTTKTFDREGKSANRGQFLFEKGGKEQLQNKSIIFVSWYERKWIGSLSRSGFELIVIKLNKNVEVE
jgi:hypothetical protein